MKTTTPAPPARGLVYSPTKTSIRSGGSSAITGKPVVPREVKLTHGDRLEGWISAFYGESQPARRTEHKTDQYGNVTMVSAGGGMVGRMGSGIKRAKKTPKAPINLDDYDWAAREGVIYGRRVFANVTPTRQNVIDSPTAGTEADQSVISYFRPLQNGDVLTYDFLYEPGQIVVHPAVGRIAFLLEPDGIKIHWMTEGGRDLSGLAADNAVVEPANRRGPAALPLKSGQWNSVRLAIEGPKFTVELNGQAVYERLLESSVGREFGLFHFKDQTAAQARNVVLKGRWPESLDKSQLAGLLVPDPAASNTDADRQARHILIGESIFSLEAGDLLERASKLRGNEAYAQLSSWVLPSPDHPVLRLAGDFSPSFPASGSGANGDGGDANHKFRLQAGGELNAPALALVNAAKSLAKLDELAAHITAIKPDGGDPAASNERAKLAFTGLIAIARGDDASAAQAMKAGKPLLSKLSAQRRRACVGPNWCWPPKQFSGRRSVSRRSSCWTSWPTRQNRKRPPRPSTSSRAGFGPTKSATSEPERCSSIEAEKSGAGSCTRLRNRPWHVPVDAGYSDSGRDPWHGRAHSSLGRGRRPVDSPARPRD